MRLYPSLISSDLLNLQKTITQLAPHCAGFHIDIMDGHFVPNLTWGQPFVTALRTATKAPLWLHLMVTNPALILARLTTHKGDLVSLHYESCTEKELHELLALCTQRELNGGLALRPGTPVSVIEPLIHKLGHVLVMSVEPGFSGQAFLPETLQKLDQLTQLKNKYKSSFVIAIDGGINQENIKSVIAHGATHIAAASAIFGQKDQISAIKKLQEI